MGILRDIQPDTFIFGDFLFASEAFLPHHTGKKRRKVLPSPGPHRSPLFQ
tara:strand:- start:391 stop:540 length:150 start_codon:yes stop_codon:yes gene_type:complete